MAQFIVIPASDGKAACETLESEIRAQADKLIRTYEYQLYNAKTLRDRNKAKASIAATRNLLCNVFGWDDESHLQYLTEYPFQPASALLPARDT